MELELTPTLRATCAGDGLNWTLEEFRTWEGKTDKVSKSGWKVVGHYTCLDQLCARALDVCLCQGMDKVVLSTMLKKIKEAKAQIMTAVQAIDERSLKAAQARKVKG